MDWEPSVLSGIKQTFEGAWLRGSSRKTEFGGNGWTICLHETLGRVIWQSATCMYRFSEIVNPMHCTCVAIRVQPSNNCPILHGYLHTIKYQHENCRQSEMAKWPLLKQYCVCMYVMLYVACVSIALEQYSSHRSGQNRNEKRKSKAKNKINTKVLNPCRQDCLQLLIHTNIDTLDWPSLEHNSTPSCLYFSLDMFTSSYSFNPDGRLNSTTPHTRESQIEASSKRSLPLQ